MKHTPVGGRLEWFVTTRAGAQEDDPAEQFHEASRWYRSFRLRESVGAALLERDETVQRLVRGGGKRMAQRLAIGLPGPDFPDVSLESAIRNRRSRRRFGGTALTLQELSTLLYATYGLNVRSDEATGDFAGAVSPPSGRVVPSAGGLYPLDIYVVVFNVEGVTPGTYHYEPFDHTLEDLGTGDPGARVAAALVAPEEFGVLPPEEVNDCGALVVIAAAFWRSRFKYGSRAYRFTLLEAGHAAQNLLLLGEAHALAAFPIGGFYDRQVDELLGLDSINESVLYVVVVGSDGERRGRD
jgi:SagB-type dehydrogenase family enzyme